MPESRYNYLVIYDDNSTEWIASQNIYKIMDEFGCIRKEDGETKCIASIIRTDLYDYYDCNDRVAKLTSWSD